MRNPLRTAAAGQHLVESHRYTPGSPVIDGVVVDRPGNGDGLTG